MKHIEADTYWAEICIAGDYTIAKQACREFCQSGLCVTVTPASFIYTDGAEEGVLVRLINYPRFPQKHEYIYNQAINLGLFLKERLCQGSFTVVAQDKVEFFTTRKEDQ